MSNASPDPLEPLRKVADPRDPRASSLLVHHETEGASTGPAIIGLPYDGGIPSRPGARFGPAAIRSALAAFGTFPGDTELPPIVDLGDVALPTMNGGEAHARIEEAARRVFSTSSFPIFLGGDHGCTGSLVRGLAAARPDVRLALISIDAHLDVREYEDEAFLSSGTPFRRALQTEVLSPERTAMLGLRRYANSRFYLEWAREQAIHLRTVEEILERGTAAVALEALEQVASGADALYLSIDLDAADAAYAPGVSAPGVGGLSSRELIQLVREIASDRRLVGADIMELSPPYDQDARTARLAARLLLELVASRR